MNPKISVFVAEDGVLCSSYFVALQSIFEDVWLCFSKVIIAI